MRESKKEKKELQRENEDEKNIDERDGTSSHQRDFEQKIERNR